MTRILLSSIAVFLLLASPAAFAEDENPDNPVFVAANAAYTNSKHAFMSETIDGIHAFSKLSMMAARSLQDQAMELQNETLANYAQGAYNNSKRASMSESVDQARDYSSQAVVFAQNARSLLGQVFRDNKEREARTSLTNDMSDSALETYEQGKPKDSLTAY